MKNLIIAITLIICGFQLSAQTVLNDSTNQNRAYLRIGVEPTTMLAFGHQHNFDIGLKNKPLTTYGEWSTSFFKFGVKNSEFKIGGIIPVFQSGDFMIVNNLGFSVGSVATKHFDSYKFAVSDEIAIGLYKKKWFVAGTAEYEKIFLNHMEHTDFYRTTYYEEAKDGWYNGAGGMFQFGIEGGITIKDRFDIHAEVKKAFTEKFNGYGGAPFHVNLGLGYRF